MRHNIDPHQISLFDSLQDGRLFERERERVKPFRHTYEDIISGENLLAAWQEFLRGKRKRKDVIQFSLHFNDHLAALQQDLAQKTYIHEPYQAFRINDPKPRNIHKATVRDRLVHHALYRQLYHYFDRKFIFDSHSSRRRKGIHLALMRFRTFARRASRNHTRTCWVLKGDINQFFASIDHSILKNILNKFITDQDIRWLLGQIIDSFATEGRPGIGLPLGNVTSQLLINVYLNEFDRFVKQVVKARFYIRFADDFVILSADKDWLIGLIPRLDSFLRSRLHLELHPEKLSLCTLASGVDFLGWVHFPHHRVLRTVTRRRAWKRLRQHPQPATLSSYLGLLKHGNTHKLMTEMQKFVDNTRPRAQAPKAQRIKKI